MCPCSSPSRGARGRSACARPRRSLLRGPLLPSSVKSSQVSVSGGSTVGTGPAHPGAAGPDRALLKGCADPAARTVPPARGSLAARPAGISANESKGVREQTPRRSPAAAPSPAAWQPPPPTTAPCCCSPARTARPSARGRRSRRPRDASSAEVDPEHVQIVTDPAGARRRHLRRRGRRRGPRRQGDLLAELDRDHRRRTRSSPAPPRRCRRAARGRQRAARALRRPARVQPGHRDEARRAGLPDDGERRDAQRARSPLCEAFEKTPVEVPDIPGFVVNRLLFPSCSAPCACSKRPAWTPRTSTRA